MRKREVLKHGSENGGVKHRELSCSVQESKGSSVLSRTFPERVSGPCCRAEEGGLGARDSQMRCVKGVQPQD